MSARLRWGFAWIGLVPAAVLISVLVAFLVSHNAAQASLRGDRAAGQQEAAQAGLLQQTIQTARVWQLRLQRDLTATARGIKTEPSWGAVAALLAAGFVYGVLHAAGPGHGKIVVASYLVATRAQMRRGLQLALLSSLAQAVSAIVLVGVLFMLLDLPRMGAADKVWTLEIVSYGLIAALGVWMFYRVLRGKGCDHGHGHDHGRGHGHVPVRERSPRSAGGLLGPILAIGIRPCSGAVIILLFTLAQGILLAGIGATFAMALGTALTVAVLAVLAVTSRRAAMRLAGGSSVWAERTHTALALLGAGAIFAFGALMLAASLSQRGPAF